MGFIVGLLIQMFYAIDKIVYGLIESVYTLFFQISNVSILSDTSIAKFTTRIYVIIGIFMLFKVAISLITMVVNPDSLTDSKAGGPALVKKIVIALVLLVAVPNIFTLGYRLQSIIISKNVLANLILGAGEQEQVKDAYENGGEMIASQVFRGFFHPKSGANIKTADQCSGEGASADDEECIYVTAKNVGDFSDIIDDTDNYDYNFIISTLAGAYIAWMIFMFCFDIAVRSVKLSFLQLIAPVPILANVDEKKGGKIFSNWVSNCVSTFLGLFIRLITIYFIIFVISEIVQNNLIGFYVFDAESEKFVYQSGTENFLLSAMVILGLLLFAKEVPKLIEDLFGIKSTGSMSLNPFKHNAFGAAVLGGAVGAGLGGLANMAGTAVGKYQFRKEHGNKDNWSDEVSRDYKEKFQGTSGIMASTIGGMFGGAVHSGASVLRGKGNMGKDIYAGTKTSVNARKNRDLGYGFGAKTRDKFTNFTGQEYSSGTSSERENKLKIARQQKHNLELIERSANDAYLRQISEQDGTKQNALYDTFDNGYTDDNGKMIYNDKSYEDYILNAAKYAQDKNGNALMTDDMIQNLSDDEKIAKAKELETMKNMRGKLVSRSEFEGINATYTRRNEADTQGKKLDKEITKLEKAMKAGKKDK